MNKKLFLIGIMCLVHFATAFAQIPNESSVVQNAKVGLVDEFVKRFNGQELHPHVNPVSDTKRRDNILYLFDSQESFARTDSVLNEITKFIDVVVKDSVRLNYEDSNWVGVARCKGTLNGKNISFYLYLTVQLRYEDMYKWVIAKASGDCFDIAPRDTSERIMLSPDSHETKFLSLSRITKEQPFNMALFMAKDYTYNPTSVFTYLVKTNQLKIDYVEHLEFIFTQVPGYMFHVQYFERESTRSGWLISKIYTVSDEEKRVFLDSLHVNQNEVDELDKCHYHTLDSLCDSLLLSQNMKETFYKRMKERVLLVKDYLGYLQSAKENLQTKEYYAIKFKDLFSSEVKVHVRNTLGDSAIVQSVSINQLCDFLFENAYERPVVVDSICIPEWQECPQLGKFTFYQSVVMSLTGRISSSPSPANTVLIIERTEEGLEVFSKMGDLYLSFKEVES